MIKFGKTFLSALGFGAPTNTQESKNQLENVCKYLERGMIIAGGGTSLAYSGINIYDALSPFLPSWAVYTCCAAGSLGCFFLIDLSLGVIVPAIIKDIVTGNIKKNNSKAVATIAFSCIAFGQVVTTTKWSREGGDLLASKLISKPVQFASYNKGDFGGGSNKKSQTPFDDDIESIEAQDNQKKQAVVKTASDMAQSKRATHWAEMGWKVKKKNAEAIAQWSIVCKEASKDSLSYFNKNFKPNTQLEEWKKEKLKYLSIATEDDSKNANDERMKKNVEFSEYEQKKSFIKGLISELGQYSTYFFLLICVARVCTQQGDATNYRGIRIWPFSSIIDFFSKKKRLNKENDYEDSTETSETGHFEPETRHRFSPKTADVKVRNKGGDVEDRALNFGEAKRKAQQYFWKLKNRDGTEENNIDNLVSFIKAMSDINIQETQEYVNGKIYGSPEISLDIIKKIREKIEND
jgi:hypothetical protein